MLGELFYWVLNMSILATAAGALVLLLRKIKRLPKFIPYVLWVVPLLRFWLPGGIASEYSLLTLISKFATRTVVMHQSQLFDFNWTFSNMIMAAESYGPIVYKTILLEHVFQTAAVIWLLLFTAALLASVLLYFATKSEIKDAVLYKENVYFSEKITAPAVYGIFRPKIVLPADIAKNDLPYILLHETVHIGRKDNLLRTIAVITACLHWFNPFVWLFLKSFLADMEITCDTKVLKTCGEENKKEYALVLLNAQRKKSVFASAFGGAKIRVRIENILSYKKLTVFSAVCCLALLAVIIFTLLTNAAI